MLKETLGDVLLVGNSLDANDVPLSIEPEDNEGAERIFTSERQLHLQAKIGGVATRFKESAKAVK